MTEQGQPATGGSAAAPAPRAQKLALQGAANGVVRGMLRAPVLSRFAGERLVTLYVVGRKSGRHFTLPVAYTRQGKDLLIGTPFGWGRNLRTGEPLAIRLKGRLRQADVLVLADEAEVVAAYETMSRDNKTFANFNKIRLDAEGNPDADDLHAVWRAGARAFRLTPR
jgi:hypothetical protein